MLDYRFIVCLSTVLLLSCSSTATQESYMNIYEALTYPQVEWSQADFGRKPTVLEKKLLKENTPQFFIGKNECGPMNFYEQYVPLLENGSRDNLKKYERDFGYKWELKEEPDCISSEEPPLYAYAWDEEMQLSNGKTEKVKILKYTFAFYKSGLPAKRSFFQKFSFLVGSSDIWHFLDIHGAIFYILNSKSEVITTVLAQHNHFRTYLHKVSNICYAVRSNEPYECSEDAGEKVYPTAPDFSEMEWIVTGKNRPFLGAWDIVPGLNERSKIEYDFEFLDSKDPLIVSWNSLGPNLKIWGLFNSFFRDSPPGMAIYTLPQLKDLWKTAQFFYFEEGDAEVYKLYKKKDFNFTNAKIDNVFKHNQKKYTEALAKK